MHLKTYTENVKKSKIHRLVFYAFMFTVYRTAFFCGLFFCVSFFENEKVKQNMFHTFGSVQ